MRRHLSLVILAMLCVLAVSPASDGIITEMSQPHYNSLLAQAQKWRDAVSPEEKDFYPSFSGAGKFSGRYVALFRFQPPGSEPINFFGRHFSVLFDSSGILVGMMRMKPEWAGMSRANQERAAETALLFVRRFTPGLWRFRESQSIYSYSIEVKRENAGLAAIEAVLSVFYDSRRKNYFFVMVAPDGSVMAFERDVPQAVVDSNNIGHNRLYDTYLEQVLKTKQQLQ